MNKLTVLPFFFFLTGVVICPSSRHLFVFFFFSFLACSHTFTHTHMHTHTHTCTQTHTHTHTHTHTCMHTLTHACMHTQPHTYTHTHTLNRHFEQMPGMAQFRNVSIHLAIIVSIHLVIYLEHWSTVL